MVFPQCCSDPGTCPCSFCILSVILYGSAAQRLDEELHLGFMWRNLNNVSQNFRLCWRDECRISCRVPTFQSVSTLKRSSRESFFFHLLSFFLHCLFCFSFPRADSSLVVIRTSTGARTPCFSS